MLPNLMRNSDGLPGAWFRVAIFLGIFFLPALAWSDADDISPVHPVQITLRVYPDQALARVDVSADFWKGNILGPTIPASIWPASLREKAISYIQGHLSFDLDGQPLKGEMLGNRLIQEPWDGPEGGRIKFDLKYPFPKTNGRILSGHADFYKDHWMPPSQRPAGIPLDFVTYVEVPGQSTKRLTVPLEKPDFQIPIDEARRTFMQRCVENFFQGTRFPLSQPAALLFIAALVLAMPPRKKVLRTIRLFSTLLIACFVFKFSLPDRILTPSLLISAGLMAIAAAWRLKDLYWTLLAAATAPGWGADLYFHATNPLLADPPWNLRLCFLAGAGVALVLAALLFSAGLGFYHNRLRRDSEALADQLLIQHARFAGSFLAALSLYLLIQTIRSYP